MKLGQVDSILSPLLLRIEQLKKSFITPDGNIQRVVDVASFSINTGQHMALSGSSGSGKTTLLNLIAGILLPDKGSVVLNGQSMSGANEAARDRLRAGMLGYIFQTFNLLQGYTCLENVLLGMSFGGKPDRNRAAELLDRVGLSRRLDYYPRQLSTGQQQRVAVARALANQPKLVLADEPTGNLDTATGAKIVDLLFDLNKAFSTTLVLVTHDERLAARCDRQVRLVAGEVVSDDAAQGLD